MSICPYTAKFNWAVFEKHSYVSGENVLLFFLRTMSSSTNFAKSVKILAFHH